MKKGINNDVICDSEFVKFVVNTKKDNEIIWSLELQ